MERSGLRVILYHCEHLRAIHFATIRVFHSYSTYFMVVMVTSKRSFLQIASFIEQQLLNGTNFLSELNYLKIFHFNLLVP